MNEPPLLRLGHRGGIFTERLHPAERAVFAQHPATWPGQAMHEKRPASSRWGAERPRSPAKLRRQPAARFVIQAARSAGGIFSRPPADRDPEVQGPCGTSRPDHGAFRVQRGSTRAEEAPGGRTVGAFFTACRRRPACDSRALEGQAQPAFGLCRSKAGTRPTLHRRNKKENSVRPGPAIFDGAGADSGFSAGRVVLERSGSNMAEKAVPKLDVFFFVLAAGDGPAAAIGNHLKTAPAVARPTAPCSALAAAPFPATRSLRSGAATAASETGPHPAFRAGAKTCF